MNVSPGEMSPEAFSLRSKRRIADPPDLREPRLSHTSPQRGGYAREPTAAPTSIHSGDHERTHHPFSFRKVATPHRPTSSPRCMCPLLQKPNWDFAAGDFFDRHACARASAAAKVGGNSLRWHRRPAKIPRGPSDADSRAETEGSANPSFPFAGSPWSRDHRTAAALRRVAGRRLRQNPGEASRDYPGW